MAALAFGSTTARAEQVDLVGLNIAGAEFADHVLPGVNGTNFFFAEERYFQYWSSKGIRLIRFPILWERLQPTLGGPLDPTYAGLITRTLGYAQKYNMKIILDMHNYIRYRGQVIGTNSVPYARYQEVWTQIAKQWSSHPGLYAYDIMNEPHDATAYWPTAAQHGINGVRAVDKRRPIFIEGNAWAGAYQWPQWNDPLLNLKDPSNNLIFQAHSYWDEGSGGTYNNVTAANLDPQYGVNRIKPFVEWLKKNGKRGMIGEIGIPDNDARWNVVLDNVLAYLRQNCIPVTYWAAGPGWGSYKLAVEPINGKERPQWPTLQKYINNTSCTAYGPMATGAAPTPAPTAPTPAPSTSDGVTSAINSFTNGDWLNGVYRAKAGFSVPATTANVAAFKVGAFVRLANGQTVKVTSVQVVGSNMSVFVEGPLLDGNAVGYPKTLTVVSSTSTAPVSGSTPTAPTPAPTTPAATGVTSTINNFTNTDWLNGVYRKKLGFSIPATTANKAAFKVGASVKMANGQIRKIYYVQVIGSNMSVFVDGAAVNSSTVGYPNKLSTVSN
ncbi:aryl-phospho-beta-D-glucosidase BglC (GH1 family) [Pseudomonas duriflava]|uniref:Aryl-phospho-beta-D-glucosidase BglC (GH1 family) n=1 Tax=Pseudomonas duriflava TaxID=459528 RepID=A0A562Q6I9_9PSED|nr:glycoside hydrolase family 5 protein [Pseudomonas duriflava]TWI52349.1 aryl-phospho-beta-D-glucosidase BglC (GH1 family) [Pseudomonas duriflava]